MSYLDFTFTFLQLLVFFTTKVTLSIYEERSHGTTTLKTYFQYFKMGAGSVSLLLAIGALAIGEVISANFIPDSWIMQIV